MSGKDWREAKEHRKRVRDQMATCPRCTYRYLEIGRSAPLYHEGEKCRDCGEAVE